MWPNMPGEARASAAAVTCEQLVAHYLENELAEDTNKRAYSTKAAYRSNLDNWILPRWRTYLLNEVKAVAVEEWLGQLSMACGTKAKLGNIMSAIFKHAMRYEWQRRIPFRSCVKAQNGRSSPISWTLRRSAPY